MKKICMLVGISIASTLLMAGGDVSPNLSGVENISSTSCKTDKVFVEEDTNLMWQDQAYTDAEDGAYKQEHSIAKAGNFLHAMNYCRVLDYAGYDDWRLPTSDELIHAHDKQFGLFAHFRDSDFWSSTPTTENRYYVVYPADAHQYPRTPKESNYIRCVRCVGDQSLPSGAIDVR